MKKTFLDAVEAFQYDHITNKINENIISHHIKRLSWYFNVDIYLTDTLRKLIIIKEIRNIIFLYIKENTKLAVNGLRIFGRAIRRRLGLRQHAITRIIRKEIISTDRVFI